MASPAVLPLKCTPEELAERRYNVDSALGTTLAEGVSPGPEVLTLSEKYVAGEITLQEMGLRIRHMSGL